MRVVIAEDLALLREGLVALLRENGIEVVAQVEDAPGLLRAIAGHEPDLAIVDVRTSGRLAPAVESAGYFVIAEALTNTAKHAGAKRSWVRLSDEHRALTVMVGDDGCGGADPDGSGIAGLRARVEALDGTLTVRSAARGGTVLEASIPCG